MQFCSHGDDAHSLISVCGKIHSCYVVANIATCIIYYNIHLMLTTGTIFS